MSPEVYEALKRIINGIGEDKDYLLLTKDKMPDIIKVKTWIDEVAKEYQEGGENFEKKEYATRCEGCGEYIFEHEARVGNRHNTCS
jgi:hypothetical protein